MADRNASQPDPYIWLIDRRSHWRKRFADALREDGFRVRATGRYESVGRSTRPILVIVACTAVTSAERRIIKSLSSAGLRTLVVATDLPIDDMREAFLAGAFDATTMPVRPGDLVALVHETLGHFDTKVTPQALSLAGW